MNFRRTRNVRMERPKTLPNQDTAELFAREGAIGVPGIDVAIV